MKKTLTRVNRLKFAAEWLRCYSGKRIVHGYAKHFRVDKLCAIKELRMIGIEIPEEYENKLRQSIEGLTRQRQLRKEKWEKELNSASGIESDEYIAYIIGYTSGGAAYGITHKEMAEINKIESEKMLIGKVNK